jgi:hypothetical protein
MVMSVISSYKLPFFCASSVFYFIHFQLIQNLTFGSLFLRVFNVELSFPGLVLKIADPARCYWG